MAGQPATMMESLNKVIQDLSQAMVTPDADIQFLTQLQGIVVGRMRQGAGQPQGQPQGGQSPPPGGPPPGGGGPGGPPPGQDPNAPGGGMPGGAPMQGGPTPNGVQPLAPQPSPDELRRLIQSKQGA